MKMIYGTNPILGMDYPDPDVIRVDDTYYMVTTTMHFMPGCEIMRSYDLINWEHLTYVYNTLDSTDGQRLTGKEHIFGKGMWAASIRYHEGIFYIVFVANDTGKTYLYRSSDIEGPWEKSLIEGFYHDSSLLFDEGKVYIVYGNTDIYLTELSESLDGPKEGGLHRLIVSDKGNPMLGYEGSHFYKINGRYYLFLIHSARDRWMRREACFSAASLADEFVGGDVLSDDMGRPPMGAAQGGIVDDGKGNWYSIVFQDSGAIGRIPVIVPVTWNQITGNADDRDNDKESADRYNPTFGADGKIPMELSLPSFRPDYNYDPLYGSDDFKEGFFGEPENPDKKHFGCFGLKSFWQFSHEPELSLVDVDKEKGILRISTDKICTNIFQAKNVLTQRMISPGCSGTITINGEGLHDGDIAGLAVYQGNYIWIGITKREGKYYAVVTTFTSKEDTWILSDELGEEGCIIPLDSPVLSVRVNASFSKERDTAYCSYLKDDEWVDIGPEQALSFRLDHFTGARFGLFVYSTKEIGGSAEFLNFIYSK